MRYSSSTGGFYPEDIAYADLPPDLVTLTDDDHAALLTGQSEGKRIVADEDGRPTLADLPTPTLEERRAAVVEAVNVLRNQRLAEGAPFAGKRFALDDTSRTDLAGMATTGALVLMGALSWPEDYATGWIAMDNTRLPLPAPQDGIALAAAVAARYAAIVQTARDLKDAALASDDPEALDLTAGWPA